MKASHGIIQCWEIHTWSLVCNAKSPQFLQRLHALLLGGLRLVRHEWLLLLKGCVLRDGNGLRDDYRAMQWLTSSNYCAPTCVCVQTRVVAALAGQRGELIALLDEAHSVEVIPPERLLVHSAQNHAKLTPHSGQKIYYFFIINKCIIKIINEAEK